MTDSTAFGAPWEARTFAILKALRDSGVVSADEWTDALGAVVGDGEVRYEHWLAALERVLPANGTLSGTALQRYREAWMHAAHRTPHGEPIDLTADDFRP